MAALKGLAMLTAILMTNLSYCSFKRNVASDGIDSSNISRTSKENEDQNHGNERDNINHGKPELAFSVVYKNNYSTSKDPRAAIEIDKSIHSKDHRPITARVNLKSDRFKQRNRPIAVGLTKSNHLLTQENRSTENKQTRTNISRHPYVQYLEASKMSAKEFASTDQSSKPSLPRLREVHSGSPEKEFVKENEKMLSSRQTNIKSKISKRSPKPEESSEGMRHAERAQVLAFHNQIRGKVDKPTAADMIFMVYNLQMERLAFMWAKQCDAESKLPVMDSLYFDEGDLGINFAESVDAHKWNSVLESWGNESVHYTYAASQCHSSSTCRNYNNIVWAETIYLGCSVAFCPAFNEEGDSSVDNVYIYACYYSPSGDTDWTGPYGTKLIPYQRGPPGSKCPPTHPYVWNNFCRSDPPCKDVRECEYPPNITMCLCDALIYASGQTSVVLHWKLPDAGVVLVLVAYSSINANG